MKTANRIGKACHYVRLENKRIDCKGVIRTANGYEEFAGNGLTIIYDRQGFMTGWKSK